MRLQIWVCLICVIATYSNGALQIGLRVWSSLRKFGFPPIPARAPKSPQKGTSCAVMCQKVRLSALSGARSGMGGNPTFFPGEERYINITFLSGERPDGPGQTAGCPRVNRAKKFMCSPRNTGNINFSLWFTDGLSQDCPDFQKVYVFKVYVPFCCPMFCADLCSCFWDLCLDWKYTITVPKGPSRTNISTDITVRPERITYINF